MLLRGKIQQLTAEKQKEIDRGILEGTSWTDGHCWSRRAKEGLREGCWYLQWANGDQWWMHLFSNRSALTQVLSCKGETAAVQWDDNSRNIDFSCVNRKKGLGFRNAIKGHVLGWWRSHLSHSIEQESTVLFKKPLYCSLAWVWHSLLKQQGLCMGRDARIM